MTRDKIDQLWSRALGQSINAGEAVTRYHFAALVLEEAAKVCREAEAGLRAVYMGQSENDLLKRGKRSEYVLGGADQSDLLADAISAMKPEVK
jgi:hypothetical protein